MALCPTLIAVVADLPLRNPDDDDNERQPIRRPTIPTQYSSNDPIAEDSAESLYSTGEPESPWLPPPKSVLMGNIVTTPADVQDVRFGSGKRDSYF